MVEVFLHKSFGISIFVPTKSLKNYEKTIVYFDLSHRSPVCFLL